MSTAKTRLSATVDSAVLSAGREAVAAGEAPSLSAWVNDALAARAQHDRRLRALREAVAEYEAEEGAFSGDELRDAGRRLRARAVVVRGR